MYNESYKPECPKFPDREVYIEKYGAKSGNPDIETGRQNAEPSTVRSATCQSRAAVR